ncbi:AMP-binding protein [Kitasatospora sp. NPDC018619]|uniref:AMP-binding protein n=1 Tax=unclassified Kitasatospora TaxID=2633591 RepID=UPI0037B0FEA7
MGESPALLASRRPGPYVHAPEASPLRKTPSVLPTPDTTRTSGAPGTTTPALPHARRAPAGTALTGLLDRQARTRPDAPGVLGEGGGLSFREPAAAARRLAARLRPLGAVPDGRVGLYVEPSVELVAGARGVLYAGAAYPPLSPEYPQERLRLQVKDSGTRVVPTQAHLRDRPAALVPSGAELVTLDDAPPPEEEAAEEEEPVEPDSPAYVIYTSGSTGRPKGASWPPRSGRRSGARAPGEADTLTDGPGSVSGGAPADRDGSALRRTDPTRRGFPMSVKNSAVAAACCALLLALPLALAQPAVADGPATAEEAATCQAVTSALLGGFGAVLGNAVCVVRPADRG